MSKEQEEMQQATEEHIEQPLPDEPKEEQSEPMGILAALAALFPAAAAAFPAFAALFAAAAAVLASVAACSALLVAFIALSVCLFIAIMLSAISRNSLSLISPFSLYTVGVIFV